MTNGQDPAAKQRKPFKRTAMKRSRRWRKRRTPEQLAVEREAAVAKAEVIAAVTSAVQARDHGRCQAKITRACRGWAEVIHHKKLRSRGGGSGEINGVDDPDDISNLVALCDPCHRWAHSHPQAATTAGLMVSAHPAVSLADALADFDATVHSDGAL
jgi:5-methylcytosine-specific restriction endonuclease McrA